MQTQTQTQKKPHKHSEIIKFWADGGNIQFKAMNCRWEDLNNDTVPGFLETYEYRVKPEPKPDFIYYVTATIDKVYSYSLDALRTDNLKLTFDRETCELKAAEVINQ